MSKTDAPGMSADFVGWADQNVGEGGKRKTKKVHPRISSRRIQLQNGVRNAGTPLFTPPRCTST